MSIRGYIILGLSIGIGCAFFMRSLWVSIWHYDCGIGTKIVAFIIFGIPVWAGPFIVPAFVALFMAASNKAEDAVIDFVRKNHPR